MKNKTLWKSLRDGMKSESVYEFVWKLGEWKKHDKELIPCKSGFHASEKIVDAMRYVLSENLAEVEVRGKNLDAGDKQVWSEMRAIKAWKWKKGDSAALATFAAEQVLHVFTRRHPTDERPQRALEAAKRWMADRNSENEDAAHTACYPHCTYSYDNAATAAYHIIYAIHDGDACPSIRAALRAADGNDGNPTEKFKDKIETWIHQHIKTLEPILK